MQKSKILSIAAAIAVSVFLWIYVMTVVNPEDTVTISGIPVTFSGQEVLREDYGLIISDGEDATIDLKISGKRSEIKDLSANNITLTVDVSKVRTPRTVSSAYDITFPANVDPSEFNITERSSGTVRYTVERLAKKTVEVIGVFEGDAAEGYEIGTMKFDRATIEVSGTEEEIAPIKYAQVLLQRTNLSETITESLTIELINNDGSKTSLDDVLTDVTEVEVTLPISKLKEVQLTVNLLEGGGATEQNAFVEIDPPSVLLSGDSTVIDGVNQINLGNIDLTEVESSETFEFRILIPNSAKNISGEETAIVEVTLKGLSTRKLRAGSIDFINVASDLEPQSLTTQLIVSLRGPMDQVSKVSPNNIRAVADLSNYTKPGTYEVPVTIYIDGYSNVGVLETRTITVSLTAENDTGGIVVPEPQPGNEGAEGAENVGSVDNSDTAEST